MTSTRPAGARAWRSCSITAAVEGRVWKRSANLLDRLREADEQGWFGEAAAVEVSIVAADRKLTAVRQLDGQARLGEPRRARPPLGDWMIQPGLLTSA